MNKKFSTLVAALLVSGLGFALVSSFNGLPMSDSPVAKAATADLRAVASKATEATALAAFTKNEVAPSAAYAVWDLETTEGEYFTIANGNFYVTEDAKLSRDEDQAAEFYYDAYAIKFADESGFLAKTTAGKLAKEDSDENALCAFTALGVIDKIVSDGVILAPTVSGTDPIEKAYMLTAIITSANLINGENYYIKAADGGISDQQTLTMRLNEDNEFELFSIDELHPEYEVALKAATPADTLAALWTAKKLEVTGQAPRYQFTNLKTGKMLAFGLNEVGTDVEFNTAGAYNTFEFEGEFLMFTAKKSDGTVIGKRYVNVNNAAATANAEPLTFSLPAEMKAGWGVDEQIHYLNVTAGFGNGFGLVFKDDKLKDLAVEKNVFSDASMITAVGFDTQDADLLPNFMFLKVAGDYSEDNKTIEAFRASKFIVVDTVRYSSIIGDQGSNGFIQFTTAKGSEMVSKDGEIFTESEIKGVTRHLGNAVFEIDQVFGSKTTDPVYVHAPAVCLPDPGNVDGLAGHKPLDKDAYIAIKNFNGKNYVGAAEGKDSRWEHVFIGANNDVDYTKVNGIVNIYSANYQTEGQIFANTNVIDVDGGGNSDLDDPIGLCDAKDVCANYPEGQFLVNYDKKTGEFMFNNRETYGALFTDPFAMTEEGICEPSPCRLKTVAGKDNVYAVVGTPDTIKIVPAKVGDMYAGYQNYDETVKHEISDAVYTLAIQPTIEGLEKTPFYIKESHATDHKLSMTTEKADMAKFKLFKFEGATDTLYMSNETYINVKGDKVEDKSVAFLYTIYNADNNEYVRYNGETGKEFFFCDPKCKFGEEDKAAVEPQRFILKQKADGAFNLVAVNYAKDEDEDVNDENLLIGKVFGASVANKLANEKNIYKITENDLITIKAVDAPEYRKIVAAPFDTIRIYKEGLENVALYAKTADKSIVSGEHFLGMTHKTEATKAQYSFFVDTAFVNRTNNNKYQYLLVLDADTVHGKVPCSDPTHAPHDSGRIDTVYGKFLVNAEDSIASWGTKHNNPYFWETTATPKLAFVNAAHVGDNLIIKNSMFTGKKALAGKDTINLKKGLTKASFAFRIVDQATQAFVIETAGGFIKWLNGTPVVVKDVKEAEKFNASKTTNKPTANEDLNASAVTVIAGNGNVTILNAAGKTVVISNMLGQTIANTVLTSDNQTIAASGIVVVAVEGEEAVKAIIK